SNRFHECGTAKDQEVDDGHDRGKQEVPQDEPGPGWTKNRIGTLQSQSCLCSLREVGSGKSRRKPGRMQHQAQDEPRDPQDMVAKGRNPKMKEINASHE